MSRLFIVQQPLRKVQAGEVVSKLDLSKLDKWGSEKIYVFPWGVVPNGSIREEDVDALMREAKQKLIGFTDEDYLVPTGSPILIAMCAMVLAEQCGGYFGMLDFMRHEASYRLVELDTSV